MSILMPTNKSKKTGFDLFNYWWDLHNKITGSNIVASVAVKKTFNSNIQRIKTAYKLSSDEIKAVILFMYMHNPLGLQNISQYGSVASLQASISYYIKWRYANQVLCREVGFIDAVMKTAPRMTTVDTDLLPYLQEMLKAMEDGLA